MAAPETGGSENGAGRNTLSGTTGRVRFLREPRPSPCPPGPSAPAIGGDCPSITSRGGLSARPPRMRRQQSDGSAGREGTRPGGARRGRFGRGRQPCWPRCVRISVFLRDSRSKGFGVPDVSQNHFPSPQLLAVRDKKERLPIVLVKGNPLLLKELELCNSLRPSKLLSV